MSENFRALLGVYTGLAVLDMDFKANDAKFAYAKNVKGWMIDAKAGGLYDFDGNNELEFGIKAEYTKYQSFKLADENFKLKETAYGPCIGYNYKF